MGGFKFSISPLCHYDLRSLVVFKKSNFLRYLLPLFLLGPTSLASPTLTPSSPAKKVDVLIIGAGLSGLSTAYYLKKAGITYHIIELSPHIGGRIRTATYPEGLHGEVGLEEFWENNPTINIMNDLKIPLEQSAPSFSSFIFQGKLYPFIHENNTTTLQTFANAEEISRFQQWDEKMESLYAKAHERPLPEELKGLMEISFKDWVQTQSNLPAILQEFIRIESEPEYAIPWNQISALDGIMEWHIFTGKGSRSYHVVGGNQNFTEILADHVGKDSISLNNKVTHILNNPDAVRVDSVDQGSFKTQSFEGKYVVSTIPLFRLLEIQFEPALTQDRQRAILSQSWGSYFTAHIFIDKSASRFWNHNFDIFPILTDSTLGVIYEGKGYEETRELEPLPNGPKNLHSNLILLNLLIHGPPAERFNYRASTAMDDVREEILSAFDKLWPGSRSLISKIEFYQYHPRAIAAWPVGRSRLDDQSELFRHPQGRVFFAGDFTENSHSDGAARSAQRVAIDILRGRDSELQSQKAKK